MGILNRNYRKLAIPLPPIGREIFLIQLSFNSIKREPSSQRGKSPNSLNRGNGAVSNPLPLSPFPLG
jgi:hypothetical protein